MCLNPNWKEPTLKEQLEAIVHELAILDKYLVDCGPILEKIDSNEAQLLLRDSFIPRRVIESLSWRIKKL